MKKVKASAVPLSFRDAILQAAEVSEGHDPQGVQTFQRLKRVRRLSAVEHLVADKYEKATRKKLVEVDGAIDWAPALDWLIANLPMIIKAVLMIIGL